MRDVSRVTRVLSLLLLALWLFTALTAAAAPQLDLVSWTVAGGGGVSHDGIYILHGTIGQHEAGGRASGPPYTLTGGFWSRTPRQEHVVYLPLVLRTHP